ncbi:activator-dependent family glycosyltransferase [Actinosynnema sp. NPDC023587]|uniref:activator-dependent family glycosyltransferase n=1 Tax=Actinosynnema sp. NPDC023587 TaxID=3154695 RepID=UPI0033F1A820
MRVLFATYSDKTHFIPMVPLAWALRAAGHDVVVATQPKLVDVVTGTGLTAVEVGRDNQLWRFLEKRPDRFEETKGKPAAPYAAAELPADEVSWDYLVSGYREAVPWWHRMINDPMIEPLVEFARHWRPDLVVWETNTFAGAIAASVVGAAHGRLMWSLDYFGRTRTLFRDLRDRRPPDDREDPLAQWLGGRMAKWGKGFSEDLVVGHFTVDHLPDSLRMATDLHHVPMRYVPYNGTSVVPRWLWEPPARPRVALTLGVSAVHQFGGYPVDVQDLLDSLADLDVEVVATLPESEQAKLRRVPDNVRLLSFVPLHALVPTCSAVVHHTGPGTMCTTARYGVPHLALPKQYDEPFLADGLVRAGAGLSVPADAATGAAVRERLVRLLDDPAFRAGADRLRAEMIAMPTPAELVDPLCELTAKYRGRAA